MRSSLTCLFVSASCLIHNWGLQQLLDTRGSSSGGCIARQSVMGFGVPACSTRHCYEQHYVHSTWLLTPDAKPLVNKQSAHVECDAVLAQYRCSVRPE